MLLYCLLKQECIQNHQYCHFMNIAFEIHYVNLNLKQFPEIFHLYEVN